MTVVDLFEDSDKMVRRTSSHRIGTRRSAQPVSDTCHEILHFYSRSMLKGLWLALFKATVLHISHWLIS